MQSSLTSLDLNSNRIASVVPELFNKPSILHIDLSYNRIETLPDINQLNQTDHLRTLNFIGNSIENKLDQIRKIYPRCVVKHPSPKGN